MVFFCPKWQFLMPIDAEKGLLSPLKYSEKSIKTRFIENKVLTLRVQTKD